MPRPLAPEKRYDAAYFARWYHDPRERAARAAVVRRKASLALAAAEHLLERPLRNVLDVGCGEAPWRAALLRLRPRLRWVGVEPSAWAAARGAARGVVRGGLDVCKPDGSSLTVIANAALVVSFDMERSDD